MAVPAKIVVMSDEVQSSPEKIALRGLARLHGTLARGGCCKSLCAIQSFSKIVEDIL